MGWMLAQRGQAVRCGGKNGNPGNLTFFGKNEKCKKVKKGR
jgi:hypothetical protein